MKKFTKTALVELRIDLDKALMAVADYHDITIHLGPMTYNLEGTRVTCKMTSTTGDGSEHAKQNFEKVYDRYDIPVGWDVLCLRHNLINFRGRG